MRNDKSSSSRHQTMAVVAEVVVVEGEEAEEEVAVGVASMMARQITDSISQRSLKMEKLL